MLVKRGNPLLCQNWLNEVVSVSLIDKRTIRSMTTPNFIFQWIIGFIAQLDQAN